MSWASRDRCRLCSTSRERWTSAMRCISSLEGTTRESMYSFLRDCDRVERASVLSREVLEPGALLEGRRSSCWFGLFGGVEGLAGAGDDVESPAPLAALEPAGSWASCCSSPRCLVLIASRAMRKIQIHNDPQGRNGKGQAIWSLREGCLLKTWWRSTRLLNRKNRQTNKPS